MKPQCKKFMISIDNKEKNEKPTETMPKHSIKQADGQTSKYDQFSNI
jgi:hypothetical protein